VVEKNMHQHEVVALTQDIPELGLVRGQVGTVVEVWQEDVCEVEFADFEGRAYAFAAVPEQSLMSLSFQPVKQAA
jgi:hypothetical protein